MERLILRGAQVFDATGGPPRAGLAVVVEDERIADVVAEGDVGHPASARVIGLALRAARNVTMS